MGWEKQKRASPTVMIMSVSSYQVTSQRHGARNHHRPSDTTRNSRLRSRCGFAVTLALYGLLNA